MHSTRTQTYFPPLKHKPARQGQHQSTDRNALAATVVGVALVARGLFMFLFSRTFYWSGIWSDSATYDQWAREIVANHDWIGQEPFFMTPLYGYFLAVVYSVAGENLLVVRAFQSAAGVATALMIFLVGEKLFSRRAGFIAGLIAAVYGPFLLSNNLLLVETLKVFFLVMMFWLLMKAREGKGRSWWMIAGAALGLCILCRPSDLLMLPAIGVWIFLDVRATRKERLIRFGSVAIVAFLLIVPVTVRNYVVSGEFIPITSNGGLNFYLGNNAQAVGVYYNVDQLDLANDPDGRNYLEMQLNKPVRHSEASSYWLSQSMEFILHQPLDFALLLARKFILFFHHSEISQLGYNYRFIGETAIPSLQLFPSFLIVGSCGILGMVLTWKRRRELLLVYGLLATQILGVVLFFVTDRFRLSAMPCVILFASLAVTSVVEMWRKKERKKLALALVLFLSSVSVTTIVNRFVNEDFPGMTKAYTPIYLDNDEFSTEWEWVGLAHFNSKDYQRALDAYAKSLHYRNTFHIHNNIGNALLAKGDINGALQEFRIGHSLNPRQAISQFSMGTAFVSRQDWVSALGAFDRAIELNPRFAPAYLNKGLTLYFMQEHRKALESLERYATLENDKSKLTTVYRDIENLKTLLQRQNSNSQFP